MPILADEIQIITTLKSQVFKESGVQYFSKYRKRGDELQVCCPYHKNGQERRPSATISLTDKRLDNGRKLPAGSFHCFTCGETRTLIEMISHCFGRNDLGSFGRKWLLENFSRASESNRDLLSDIPNPYKSSLKKDEFYIPEEELDSYRVYHDYMFKRGLTNELIDIFDVGYDPNFSLENKDGKKYNVPSLTFPVRDKNGNVLFIARRSVQGKVFHYPNEAVKPLYGIYELFKYWDIGVDDNGKLMILDELYIVESIFNAITCWKYKVPAIALLGTGTPGQIKQIERLPVKKYILGHDPDEGGDRGIERFLKHCHKTNIEIMDIPAGKDINDLSEDEFFSIKRFPSKGFRI